MRKHYRVSKSAVSQHVMLSVAVCADYDDPMLAEITLDNRSPDEIIFVDRGHLLDCQLQLVDQSTGKLCEPLPISSEAFGSRLDGGGCQGGQRAKRKILPQSKFTWRIDLREFFVIPEGQLSLNVEAVVASSASTRIALVVKDLVFSVAEWQKVGAIATS